MIHLQLLTTTWSCDIGALRSSNLHENRYIQGWNSLQTWTLEIHWPYERNGFAFHVCTYVCMCTLKAEACWVDCRVHPHLMISEDIRWKFSYTKLNPIQVTKPPPRSQSMRLIWHWSHCNYKSSCGPDSLQRFRHNCRYIPWKEIVPIVCKWVLGHRIVHLRAKNPVLVNSFKRCMGCITFCAIY